MTFMRGSHPSYGSSVLGAAARASRTPRWKLASLFRTSSAERDGAPPLLSSGAAPGSPTDPGTRLALGTRRGRPAGVVSPVLGAATVSAARQPSSAGEECQAGSSPVPVPVPLAAAWGGACVVPLRRNQSDSSESKIGSRCSCPFSGGAGTRTPLSAPLLPLPLPLPLACVGAGGMTGDGPEPPKPPKLPVPGLGWEVNPPAPGAPNPPDGPLPEACGGTSPAGPPAPGPAAEVGLGAEPKLRAAPLPGGVGSGCGPLPRRGCGPVVGGENRGIRPASASWAAALPGWLKFAPAWRVGRGAPPPMAEPLVGADSDGAGP